jgi:hypothetical protein
MDHLSRKFGYTVGVGHSVRQGFARAQRLPKVPPALLGNSSGYTDQPTIVGKN